MDGNPLDEAERLIATNRADEAARFLQDFIGAGHGGVCARQLWVRALMAIPDCAKALEQAHETTLLYPNVAEAALSLGEILLQIERPGEAIAEIQRALRLSPDSQAARFLLGAAWLTAGEADKALEQFAQCDDDTPGLAEKIADSEAIRRERRSDAHYVRHLFDSFSADYDRHMLRNLQYRAPTALRSMLNWIAPEAAGWRLLDLGCGTGLAGEAFRDVAAEIVGIDLSPKMIEAATARKIYTALYVADIESPPVTAGTFDLALAADTLVYLGDLAPVMAAVRQALNPGGRFLFSVERCDDDGYELGPKRRWRHSESYLRQIAERFRFDVTGLMAFSPRTEAGEDVAGFVVALQRRGNNL